MSPQTKRLFLWFLTGFFILFIVLILISLFHNFTRPKLVSTPAKELRGVWMSRFDYAESFPSHDQDSIRQYIAKSFQQIRAANLNVVFFQIRGNGDVLYPSRYEPWSALLTGKLGQHPGWDPLAFAIQQAHALGLELHAWVNVFPAWRGTTIPPRTKPIHPLLSHPEWLVCDSSGRAMPKSEHYITFSPGNPAVHEHILRVIAEIVSNYDVDGIHFDYVRYPEGSRQMGYSYDRVSLARFKSPISNPLNLDWDDWQREQVTTFIAKAYDCITNIKPYVKVSAAVIGNYKTSGWNGYYTVFQDARRWAEIGKIDWIIPMIYYGRFQRANSFPLVLKEWKNYIEDERPVFAGMGVYRLEWNEILDEISDVRNNKLKGMVFFAISSLDSSKLAALKTLKFFYPALVPPCPWKIRTVLSAPSNFNVTETADHNLLFTWQVPPAERSKYHQFVIYRERQKNIDYKNGENIFAIIPGDKDEYQIKAKQFNSRFYYIITGIDRVGNESPPSNAISPGQSSSNNKERL